MTMVESVFGRDAELGRILALMELGDDGRPVAVVLDGEPGIGRTSVWRGAVAQARMAGRLVLMSSPSAAEADIAFAALGDLIGQVPAEFRVALPAPQQMALEAALLLREPGPSVDRLALGLAVGRLLSTVAATRPVLIAVDDVQWIDEPSRSALTFAARRLGDARVLWLTSRRTSPGVADQPFDLGRTLAASRHAVIRIGPLDLGALDHLVRDRIGLQLRRPDLVRLLAASGGNPFFALELAPAFADGSSQPVRLPASLTEAIQGRLRDIDDRTGTALLVLALSPIATMAGIERVTGDDDAWAALRPALDRDIVEVLGPRITFTHPLFASGVLERTDPRRRAAMHRRLAEEAETRELRAHHLAAAAGPPDESVAAEIEAGARDALARGAPEIGALLAAGARAMTAASGDEAVERGFLEAECLYAAGDMTAANTILARLASETGRGPLRARILLRLAWTPRNYKESVDLCEEALLDAGDDPALASEIAITLSTSAFLSGDNTRATAEAHRAITLAEVAGNEAGAWRARSALAMMEAALGLGWDLDTIRRAAEVEEASFDRPPADGAGLWYGQALVYTDRYTEGRTHLKRMLARAVEVGDAMATAEFLGSLGNMEARAGRFLEARRLSIEAIEQFEQLGWEQRVGEELQALAGVEAWLGNDEASRDAARRGTAITRAGDDNLGEVRHHLAMALIEAGMGRWAELAAICDAGLARTADTFVDVAVNPLIGFAIEAHAYVGDIDRADEIATRLEAAMTERSSPRNRLTALRSRGAVQAAAGDLEAASASLVAAMQAAGEECPPHELGRTLLLLGKVLRRAGRKAEARTALEKAVIQFDTAGVVRFAAQARAELGRISGRRAGDVNELTEAERRTAALVAEGRSNKEVAAAQFVSVKTVEVTLTRVYRKLGVRSRAELAATLSSNPKD
jgi:DNA-binding CsgD family transcriptional regulator